MPKPPYPLADGGCVAMANSMMVWKKAGLDVHVFCLSTPKHPFQPDAFPKEWQVGLNLFHQYVDTGVKLSHLPFIIFSSKSYQAHRFFNKEAAKKIQSLLHKYSYDMMLFDSLYAAIYLPEIKKIFNGKIFLRSHNMEHEIWRTLRLKERNPLKRMLMLHETNRLKNWEESIYQQVDAIFTITPDDEKHTRNLAPHTFITHLPVSISIKSHQKIRSLHLPLRLFHLGAMNWEPNQDAIRWFVNEWFPKIHQQFPDITFHFAGKGMPKEFLELKSNNVFCYREVPDASSFMLQYDVLVVPLRHGSGLRIKILEAMALGIPVISTRKGAGGMPVTHGENILLADDPESCCEAIHQLLHHPGLYQHISRQAIQFIHQNYSTNHVVNTILNTISQA
jgi:glycosyltransferase involved in cell wall biosynthesis